MGVLAPAVAVFVGFVYMLGPGWLIVRAFGIRRYTYLLSTSFSLAVLACTQVPFRFNGGSFVGWVITLHVTVLVLVAAGIIVRRKTNNNSLRYRTSVAPWFRHGSGRVGLYAGFAGCLIVYVGYYWALGAYTEVPADFWTHLVSVKWEYQPLLDGDLLKYGGHAGMLVDREYVHFMHATLAHLSGLPYYESVSYSMFVSSTLFLGGVYWLSVAIFAGHRWTINRKTMIAVFTVALTFIWFGVSVFSFVRYYALAPAMVNYLMLFAAVALHLDYLRRPSAGMWQLGIVVLWVVVMAIVHRQEAFFAVVLISLITIYTAVYRAWGREDQGGSRKLDRRAYSVAGIIAVMGATAATLVTTTMEMNDPMAPYIIDVHGLIPFLKNMDVLNPTMQFYDVLAPFGVLAYLYFFVNWRRFKDNVFIMAGMASPVFTVFNPLFVWVFLSISPFQTLWRLALLIPIAFVGAIILVELGEKIMSRAAPYRIRALAFCGIVVLCASLLPVNTKFYENTKSRLYTLLEPRPGRDMEWLADGIEYVNDLQRRSIITDPVTSYVFRAASKHGVRGWKFYEGKSGYNLRKLIEEEGISWLSKHKGDLLVVNKREGPVSRNGRISRHWPTNVFDLAKWYPERFTEKIESHGSKFDLLWESRGLFVYEIKG